MRIFKQISLFLAAIFAVSISMAQVTTSSMSGTVRTETNELLVGASIKIVHTPTGSVYRTQTRKGGIFSVNNMNPGGPYSIEVSFINYGSNVKSDIYLTLGDVYRINLILEGKTVNLGNVTVVGAKKTIPLPSKGGTEALIDRDKMANLPTVGRNINDYLRSIPFAKLSSANNEGITIAGQNPKYNSFYIDGALNNDVFGLANSGTNGGQTSTPPISIDAIDQFQVVISPYDASLGNFTGGGINAVTKSGSNSTKGTIYLFTRNQNLAGKTPTGDKANALKLADFSNKTYGFSVGGALVKNKLFYFINAESQRDERPQPFDVANNYQGNTKSPAQIQRLIDTLQARGKYNPGGYLDNPETVTGDRITTKIDWNVNEKHKLSISYRYSKADRFNTNPSSSQAINFGNNGWIQPNRTHTFSTEFKSKIGRNSSNRLLITYSKVADDRSPIGDPYPRIVISDGTGTGTTQGLVIGPDPSSNINILTQKNWSLLNVFKFNLGNHSLSTGLEWEYSDVKNAFIQRVWGEYQYDSVNQFYNNLRPRQFRTAYSLIDGISSDATKAAASFKIAKGALFINDELRVDDNFLLNFGIRADFNNWLSNPYTDPYTNNIAIPTYSTSYNLQGAQSGLRPNIPVSISPRIGFTYKIPEENLVIRGGIGLFTGRVPLAWPGGVYNNNGLFIGGFIANSGNNIPAWNNVRFRPDPNAQWTAQQLGIGLNKGGLNLISANFRNPRVLRTSLGIDKKLGNGWSASMEALYSKNINEIYYTNLNARTPIATLSGPGIGPGRQLYSTSSLVIPGGNPFDNAILLTNNNGPKGFSYNFNLSIEKKSTTGLNFSATYSYGNSVVVNEGTSSTNISQWQFMETVNGRNNITRSNSDFNLGHRIFAYLSKKITYANDRLATTLALVYTGQSGAPFSYVYSGAIVKDDVNAGGAGGNDLIYIPAASEMNNLVIANNTVGSTVYDRQSQINALEQYIQTTRYLKNNRGGFAERNASRLPFTNIFDLKIVQDFNLKVAKHPYKFQVTLDIFNFGNMINRDWGRSYFLSNDQFAAISFRGFTDPGKLNPATNQILSTYGSVNAATGVTMPATVPVLSFNPQNTTRDPWNVSTSTVPSVTARWIGQLGVRFNF